MKLTIQAPENEMENYLIEVLRQYQEGYARGYINKETQWEEVNA